MTNLASLLAPGVSGLCLLRGGITGRLLCPPSIYVNSGPPNTGLHVASYMASPLTTEPPPQPCLELEFHGPYSVTNNTCVVPVRKSS